MKDTTVLIFMAGDNDLDFSGTEDLKEMQQVVMPSHLKVVVQFDRRKAMPWENPEDHTTKRLLIKSDELIEVGDLGETNTGDPKVLEDFIVWGTQQFPADHYILIIWNHGTGVKDEDIYHAANLKPLFAPGAKQKKKNTKRAGFYKNAIAYDRAIATDDNAGDFLDNLELKAAIEAPGIYFDILGFDACLMSMLEIQYQLKHQAQYIIGSQEIEPPDGWPYHDILEHLATHSLKDAEVFAQHIVERFTAHYQDTKKEVTQSAFDTSKVDVVVQQLNDFTEILLKHLAAIKPRLLEILSSVQKFRDKDYIDLYDFVNLCEKNLDEVALEEWSQPLKQSIKQAVIANSSHGSKVANAHGTAIYFPLHPPKKQIMVLYEQLDMHQTYPNWLRLIRNFHRPTSLKR